MKYIFGYFASILAFSLIYFVAIFYVQFDAVVKNINYVASSKRGNSSKFETSYPHSSCYISND